ncbi:MAG: nucleotidyltransferase domain-containing protein [Spirochaetes bacterium]|nr:nucleotidyltransferase domain-containing protein [Spirochaetota bacterium]
MRLTEGERETIRNAVRRHFGEEATVVLFGSRADDAKRGGDVDLLVESPLTGAEAERAKIRTVADIQLALGDQKVDLVATRGSDTDERAVVAEAYKHGIAL